MKLPAKHARLVLALAACGLVSLPIHSADISATVPVTSGFSVRGSTGAERLRVEGDTGAVNVPGLSSGATSQTSLLCYGASGLLGPCAAGVGTGTTGAQGPVGPAGPAGAAGTTGPAGAVGATGAIGTTGPAGPAGPAGATGTAGATGPAGRSFLNGAVNPTATDGTDGDFYLNTATNLHYGPKATGVWPAVGVSVVGPAGATGTTGATGSQGPAGVAGATGGQGPAGSVGATGSAGPQGPTGATGPAGTSLQNGSGAPTAGTGNDGDFYVDTANNILYGPKAASAWPATGIALGSGGGATQQLYVTKPAGQTTAFGSSVVLPDVITWGTPVVAPPAATGNTFAGDRFTVNKAGLYLVNVQLVGNQSACAPQLDVNNTGNSASGFYGTTGAYTTTGQTGYKMRGVLTITTYFNQGDSFQVRALPSSTVIGCDIGANASTYLRVVKLD